LPSRNFDRIFKKSLQRGKRVKRRFSSNHDRFNSRTCSFVATLDKALYNIILGIVSNKQQINWKEAAPQLENISWWGKNILRGGGGGGGEGVGGGAKIKKNPP